MKLAKHLKEKFGYDVSALENWKDNTLPSITTDLVETNEFLNTLTLEEGVKGTREIALLEADVALQAKANCNPSPDGSTIMTGVDLTTKPLYMGIEFCNEDLNKKMTQVLNTLGMKMQEGKLPAPLETILMAYLTKVLQKKALRAVWLGDTTSLDPDLLHFDGLKKLIRNNTDVVETASVFTTLDSTNAYDAAVEVYEAINPEVFDSEMPIAIVTGRDHILALVKQYNDANPYTKIKPTKVGGSLEVELPEAGVIVKSLPPLAGSNEIFAMPLPLTFLGVDSRDDENFDIKFDSYNEKLKAETSFRLGTQIVWGKYFVKLQK